MKRVRKKPGKAVKKPCWTRREMELRWAGEVIKAFHREAPGQMKLLDEFERQSWPATISIVDATRSERAGKRWIGDNVTNLNRGLLVIRFHADGANGFVSWGLR